MGYSSGSKDSADYGGYYDPAPVRSTPKRSRSSSSSSSQIQSANRIHRAVDQIIELEQLLEERKELDQKIEKLKEKIRANMDAEKSSPAMQMVKRMLLDR